VDWRILNAIHSLRIDDWPENRTGIPSPAQQRRVEFKAREAGVPVSDQAANSVQGC
jgi:hypothetical protein